MKASELKKGMIIQEGSDYLVVVDIEHKKSANTRAVLRTTLKNLLDPRIVNRRLSPTDIIEKADLDSRKAQYLYKDHAGFHFMDMETYETIVLSEESVGDTRGYLKENAEMTILSHGHAPLTIELSTSVDLKVAESAPGIRGDTSGKATKQAKLETGLTINVPLFIKEGELIKVDTRTGEYLGRA